MIPSLRRYGNQLIGMPTPIGHALGGIAAGTLIGGAAETDGDRSRLVRWLALLAVLGMLPDADFLVGAHREASHSVGAVLLVVGGGVLVVPRQPRIWAATGAAYLTHVVLDWLGTDTVAPFGLMALWPIDTAFYMSSVELFHPVCRQYWLVDCWTSLGRAVAVELAVLGPFAAVGLVRTGLRRRRSRDRSGETRAPRSPGG